MSTPTPPPSSAPAHGSYVEFKAGPKYQKLRKTFTSFAFPTIIAVIAWYFVFVLLSTFAEGFMSIRVMGNLTLGMVIGLLQFVTSWFATWLYVRRAGRILDPMAAELRAELEAGGVK